MARMRVHELAKELNMNNKDIIDRIVKLGIQVKNHMSTLTESTVEKIRQQCSTDKGETVEEKRIGRVVVRRRKKTSPEELKTGEGAGVLEPESLGPESEVPVMPSERKPEDMPAQEDRSPQALSLDEVTVEEDESSRHLPSSESKTMEDMVQPPERPDETPAVQISPESISDRKPEVQTKDQEDQPSDAPVGTSPTDKPKTDAVEEPPTMAPEEEYPVPKVDHAVKTFEPEPPEQDTEEMPAARPTHEQQDKADPKKPVPHEGADAQEETDEEESDDGKSTARKSKKRRRKKVRKDEPARIIKLPSIIPDEPEEEPSTPVVPQKFKVGEEIETKEVSRKKRVKVEDTDREVTERKRQKARKEVFEKKDLYSKKELAAQADRTRPKEREVPKEPGKSEQGPTRAVRRRIRIDEAITVANLARHIGVKAGELIKKLLLLGVPATINQSLDFDTAALIASEYDFEVEKAGFEEEDILQTQADEEGQLQPRPPVITVMGHVDHGKTSLLDAIRHTNVIEGEAGGITQHIGAYYVKLENGNVVFLDTPGHEAFTSMRARGAKVTDIVILLVAADDGVMPQTVEAINHAKAANVPIIVAINKIDKPGANLDRVRRQLADHGLISEAWGGSTTMVEISAKQRLGIEDLLEMVLLQAEIMELKANPNKPARGRVVESKLDKGRGPVATILIQEGTLRAGDIYVCGTNSGRVRNMFNDRGQRLESATPSMPVEVLGFSGVPNAGDQFIVLADEKQAKLVAEHRQIKLREKELVRSTKVTLESLFDQIQEGQVKELNLIIKTDVHGSLEAITESLHKLPTAEVKVGILHTGTGAITESDVLLASASNAIIIGFNVRADSKVTELAEQEHVDMRFYDIIYQLISDVQDAMVGMLEPVYKEKLMGRVEVRQTFRVPKIGMIAGSYVLEGRVERGARVRTLRDQVVVNDGKIGSLRRFKDDVKEVKAGFECGVGIENFNDLKMGDILEVYEMEEIKPTLLSEDKDKKSDA